MLADCYFNLSKPIEAKQCLERCLEIYPQKKEVKATIEKLDVEIKKLKEVDIICDKASKIKDKSKLKELLESVPVELKSHPKISHLRNVHFIKEKSSGKDLIIYCFYTAEPFNPDIINNEGRGGSEEAVYHASKRLSDIGWNVTVYANTGIPKEKKFGNVKWKPFWDFNIRDKQDILIVWRHPLMFDFDDVNADKKYVWLHDVIKPGEFTPQRLEKITKIFALSKWQRDLFPLVPEEKFMVTGNGVDQDDIKEVQRMLRVGIIKRNPYRLIYASSPDRGLKCLLKLFPYIKKEVPQAELDIFYGWHVWDTMYENNPEMMAEKKEIVDLMEQDGVVFHDRIGQKDILKEYAKSSILAYPSEFTEISFIGGMKAQALGAIPVTTNVAALDETIQFGLKVDSKKIYTDITAQKEWVSAVIDLLKNPPTEEQRKDMMDWAKNKLSWDKIINNWNEEFLK
jgi:glycosyltransferase involved in cell wall biosynthesis